MQRKGHARFISWNKVILELQNLGKNVMCTILGILQERRYALRGLKTLSELENYSYER